MERKTLLIFFKDRIQVKQRGGFGKILVFVFLLFGVSSLKSKQKGGVSKIDFDHYKGLVCEGELPVDFNTSSVKKIEKSLGPLEDDLDMGKKERALEKEHIIRSVFAVDELLMSGRILFGDPKIGRAHV